MLNGKFNVLEDTETTEDVSSKNRHAYYNIWDHLDLKFHCISSNTTSVDTVKCGQQQQHQNNCKLTPQKNGTTTAHGKCDVTMLWAPNFPTKDAKYKTCGKNGQWEANTMSVPHPTREDLKISKTWKKIEEEENTDFINVADDHAMNTDEIGSHAIMVTSNVEYPEKICIHSACMDGTILETVAFTTVEIPADIEYQGIWLSVPRLILTQVEMCSHCRSNMFCSPNNGKKGIHNDLTPLRTELMAYNSNVIPELGTLSCHVTWKSDGQQQTVHMNTWWYIAHTH